MARRRRHRNARRVVVVNRPRRRRHHRRRVNRARHRYNPPRSHRRRHHRRHYRRNPSRAASRVVLSRPMSWLPYVFTGGAAATVSAFAPRLVFGPDVDANKAYLTQAGVAVAGAIALPLVGLRGWHPMAWIVGAGAPIVAHFVGDRVAGWLGLSGTGWYPYQALHQAPYYPPRLYAHGGAHVGMYPFEGGAEVFTNPEQSFTGAPEAPFEHLYNN